MASHLSVADAQSRLLALAHPVAMETLPVRDAAGRWAATDIAALRTQPYADLSAMDGYAIRFAELPGPWRIVGASMAGRPLDCAMGPGEAARIFTGAAMPGGSDTVLIQEEARSSDGDVRLAGDGPARAGQNVRRRGLDFTAGDRLIARGERLTPARIALAAAGGHAVLPVRRRVCVAVLSNGDELVEPGTGGHAALPESNRAMLAALLADLPVEIVDLGILPDRLEPIRAAFAALDADIVVTTGGASVGDHDLIRPAFEAAGGAIDLWRVALRPGKPTIAGRIGNAVMLGLPGNPVSVFVTAHLFLRPLIAALGGAIDPLPRILPAILGDALPANGARADYMRGAHHAGRVKVAAIQDSSMLLTLARADCLVLRAPHAPPAAAGDQIEILPIA